MNFAAVAQNPYRFPEDSFDKTSFELTPRNVDIRTLPGKAQDSIMAIVNKQ